MDKKSEKCTEQVEGAQLEELLPPYTSSSSRQAQAVQPSSSQFPPQPYHSRSPSRCLKIIPSGGLRTTGLQVQDPQAGNAVLYTVNFQMRKPQVLISCKTGNLQNDEVTVASFHRFHKQIDIVKPSGTIALSPRRRFHFEASYSSPALLNTTLTWRSEGHFKTFDLVCSDARNMCLAKISTPKWRLSRDSQVEFFGDIADNAVAVDELVTTGLVFSRWIQRVRSSSAAAAGAAGAAGGGGA